MIPFVDLKREYAEISEEVNHTIQRVVKNGWFILGQEVKKFEGEFSKYIGTKYGLGVNSGSDALFLALKALGIREGDEVIRDSKVNIMTAKLTIHSIASTYGIHSKKFLKKFNPEWYIDDIHHLSEIIER